MRPVIVLLGVAALALAAESLEVFGRNWSVPVAADWKIEGAGSAQVLTILQNRGPQPGPRRPIQFAIAQTPELAHVTLSADVMPINRSLMLVFAYHDEAHFDYAHLSTDTGIKQPVHNGIFHVFGGERVRISSQKGPAAFGKAGEWYHVVLTYDGSSGRVSVKVNGEAVPALEAVDMSLGAGKVGLGSFDEKASFKNVKIDY